LGLDIFLRYSYSERSQFAGSNQIRRNEPVEWKKRSCFRVALYNTARESRVRNRRVDIVILNPTPVEQPDDSAHSHVTVTPNTTGAAPPP
jgi:hypothetical protein